MTLDLTLTTLLTLGGVAAAIVGWLVRQDRRIEDLRNALASVREAAQTRSGCSEIHRAVDSKIAAADKESALVVQRLDALTRTLDDLRQMLAQLQSDVSAIAIQQRREPLRRQRTDPHIVMPQDDE